ncbi:CST complex subunit Ten1 [Diaporthe sp. PMI_573]|nr:CST complex subunit Ten1 [Diaporthaceae sp. PMI_573]
MSSGPLPSKLTLLSSLPSHDVGTKVRFLGCVTSYATVSGQLTLQHQFPKSTEIQALVDVRLLLEKLTAGQTSVGEWVNVIGYINPPPPVSATLSTKRKRSLPTVHVQALMLWSAGSLDIGRYEICLESISAGNKPDMESRTSRKT